VAVKSREVYFGVFGLKTVQGSRMVAAFLNVIDLLRISLLCAQTAVLTFLSYI
jgi:hypothetical protein